MPQSQKTNELAFTPEKQAKLGLIVNGTRGGDLAVLNGSLDIIFRALNRYEDLFAKVQASLTTLGDYRGLFQYAGGAPVAAELVNALAKVGHWGYFLKGDADPVYHCVCRATSTGTITDFGLVAMP